MALPLNEVPNYTCKLPSTGQTITYRPFLVKEQKVMLMAMESENDKEIGQAVTDTMQSCIVSDIDIAKLPIYDFEYLYWDDPYLIHLHLQYLIQTQDYLPESSFQFHNKGNIDNQ